MVQPAEIQWYLSGCVRARLPSFRPPLVLADAFDIVPKGLASLSDGIRRTVGNTGTKELVRHSSCGRGLSADRERGDALCFCLQLFHPLGHGYREGRFGSRTATET
jgi:hypothetical protein